MIYPEAIWTPGPVEKTGYPGYTFNLCQGVVCHSMVGYKNGALAELYKLTRRASWHFSVLQNGQVLQHYDTELITWHCGSLYWNARLIGIEHEGGYNPTNEPLTVPQLESSVRLVKWLGSVHNFTLARA